jgi:hypothetical protein
VLKARRRFLTPERCVLRSMGHSIALLGGATALGVLVGDKVVGTVEVPAHYDVTGSWGVGAQQGSSGRWHDLKLQRK